MTKNTINWAEHLEAARTKIKNLTADAYPIPTGPDLPTIKNISVLDHEDIDGILVRCMAVWGDKMCGIAVVVDDIDEVNTPLFWEDLVNAASKNKQLRG